MEIDVPLHFDISRVEGGGENEDTKSMTATCDALNAALGDAVPPSPPVISLISLSLEEPLPEPLTKGYLAAAVAQVDLMFQHTTTMPSFTWTFRALGLRSFAAHQDRSVS
jgi:hypothetical protein